MSPSKKQTKSLNQNNKQLINNSTPFDDVYDQNNGEIAQSLSASPQQFNNENENENGGKLDETDEGSENENKMYELESCEDEREFPQSLQYLHNNPNNPNNPPSLPSGSDNHDNHDNLDNLDNPSPGPRSLGLENNPNNPDNRDNPNNPKIRDDENEKVTNSHDDDKVTDNHHQKTFTSDSAISGGDEESVGSLDTLKVYHGSHRTSLTSLPGQ